MNPPDNRRAQGPNNGNSGAPSRAPNVIAQAQPRANTFRSQTTTNPIRRHDTTPNAAYRATALVRQQKRRRLIRRLLLAFGVLAFVAIGAAWIYVSSTLTNVMNTISTVLPTPPPVLPGPTPGSTVVAPTQIWGSEPVNILLIGLDYRPQEQDTRADTQIVVHIDPVNKTASMVSIPRDMWVPIPQFGEDRVNAAYQYGDTNKDKIPGMSGPALAMATIQQDFGIPIHYYAQVTFTGFEKVIDSIGGVTIDVPRPLVDDDYPLPNYGATRIYIPAGLQHMDGKTALEYARSRHADSDIGRNSRQQQVLLAAKEQGVNLNLITRINDLASQLGDAVKTDLSISQIISLAQLAKDMGPESIQTVLIEPPDVTETILPSGADVLIPNWDLIRPKLAKAFANPQLVREGARVSVQNGTMVKGAASRVSTQLSAKGIDVVDVRSTNDQGSHPKSSIIDYTGGMKKVTIDTILKELKLDPSSVVQGDPQYAPVSTTDNEPADIAIIIGDDKAK